MHIIVKHLVFIDQIAKLGASALLKDTIVLIPNLLELNLVKNTGISFGFFSQLDPTWSTNLKFGILLITSLICLYHRFNRYSMTHLRSDALEFIIAGAIGNLLDRFLYGGIVDFLTVKLFGASLFTCNIADIYLTVGVIMYLMSKSKPQPRQPESFKDILFKEDDL